MDELKLMQLIEPHECFRVQRSGRRTAVCQATIQEHTVAVWLDGALAFEQGCTNDHLDELVLGHLLTEGHVQDVRQICSLSQEQVNAHRTVFRVCLSRRQSTRRPVVPAAWSAEWVFHQADIFAQDTALHARTSAAHSCMLAREGEILCRREDLGRHNALDKVIGWAMKNHVPLESCMLYSSGRIPVDMMQKVIASGVGVIASNASATAQAIELAQAHGITLLCNVRTDKFDVFYDAYQKRPEQKRGEELQ